MTAPLPQGLLNVTSISTSGPPPSDPAEILFERHQILYNFWKVHEAKSRATRDPSDTRCRDLFWRVWGNPRLARNLSASALTRLFIRCQQPIDITPFDLDTRNFRQPSGFLSVGWHSSQFRQNRTSQSSTSNSISPTNEEHDEPISWSADEPQTPSESTSLSSKGHARASSQNVSSRPAFHSRKSSNSSKRTSFVAGGTKTRARIPMGRKRSSQSNVPTQSTVNQQRSPRQFRDSRRPSLADVSTGGDESGTAGQSSTGPQMAPRPSTISAFELPSVSSWQSVDSQSEHHRASSAQATNFKGTTPILVDKNFRERFAENQKNLHSSSNLASMSRIRKTGSVVRFADEVDLPEELRKAREKEQLSTHIEDEQPPHRHRDSVSSIAAISDDGSDEEVTLPRTKSQLSMMITDMKRKESEGHLGMVRPKGLQTQQGKDSGKRKEDEDQLLEMARRDGVTKAGGVPLLDKKRLKKTGKFEMDDTGYESPEGPLY